MLIEKRIPDEDAMRCDEDDYENVKRLLEADRCGGGGVLLVGGRLAGWRLVGGCLMHDVGETL